LEELVTLCRNDRERQQFLDLLADLLEAHPDRLRLVITLRSDFEPQFRSTPLEPLWQAARFVVPAMTREELREAIEEPASVKVVYFESLDGRGHLVDQLIDEVAGMPGALPLLSFALSELYLRLARRYLEAQITDETIERAITWADYDELGGVTKSLTRRADEEYEALVQADPAYEQTIRHVMLRMVAVGGEMARRQVPESELRYPEPENTRIREAIDRFLSARLLVSGTDADNNPYIEPAHDVLVRGWEKLLSWKKKEEENLILQRRLTPVAAEWDSFKNKKHSKGILDKAEPVIDCLDRRLFAVENLVTRIPVQIARFLRQSQNQQELSRQKPSQFLWDSNPYLSLLAQELQSEDNWLNQVEGEFVQQSVLQKRRKGSWRWRIAIAVMLGLSGLTVAALFQLQQALRQRVEQLAATSQALLATNPIEAEINAIAATGLSQSPFVQFPDRPQFRTVNSSLLNVIQESREQNQVHPESTPISVAYSPDGKRIVSNGAETVQIWDASTGKAIGKPFTRLKLDSYRHPDGKSVAFSPDGKRIVSGGFDKTVRIWDASTGEAIGKPFTSHEDIMSVAFSPDGKYIVSGGIGTVRILDASTGEAIGKPLDPSGTSGSLAFSPDGKRILGAASGVIQIWNAATGEAIGKPFGYDYSVNPIMAGITSVAYSPDGKRIVSGSYDKTVRIWDASTGEAIGKPFTGHGDIVKSVAFSPDGKYIVSGSHDKTVRIWDASTGEAIGKPFTGHGKEVISVAFSPDGKHVVSSSFDGTVRVWDATSKETIGKLLSLSNSVDSVAFSPDGKSIVSVDGSIVRVWNVRTGQPISKPMLPESNIISIAFSPDGKRIVSGTNRIQIWNASTGEAIGKPFTGHGDTIISVAFSPDGKRIISGSRDRTVRIWDISTRQLIGKPFTVHGDWVNSIAFSPDGKRIASSNSDATVQVWDVTTGGAIGKPTIYKDLGTFLGAFSPNGKRIVSGSGPTLQIWDASTGEVIGKPLTGHEGMGMIDSVAFSPDGKRIVSGSGITLQIWDASTGEAIGKPFTGHEDWVKSVAFSPDGKHIVSGSNDKTVRIWNIDWADPLQFACQKLRYHRSLIQPKNDVAKEAKKTCKHFVWK
jgi:WD40 repeat protein